MHPILINLGPVVIYSYGFFIASAILLALGISMHEAKKRGLNHRMVPDVGFYLIISAIIGSRILYVIYRPEPFINDPLKILFFWKGGLVFLGGAILAFITGWVYLRHKGQSFWQWTDVFSPGIAAGQALGRIGCLMAGCCYGRPTDLPWGITFTNPDSLAPLHTALHPTQIYHSLAGVLTFILLVIFKKRLSRPGQLFCLLIFLYSLFRFFIEFFRGDPRAYWWIFSYTQWGALALLLLSLYFLLSRPRST